MSELRVTPENLLFLLEIESRRPAGVSRSWELTVCHQCHGEHCMGTPVTSQQEIRSWLCTTCGYFETGPEQHFF